MRAAPNWREVPVPLLMAGRPRDERGFPITFVTLVENGTPDFTTISSEQLVVCIRGRLCGLCGHRLHDGEAAFIGGPGAIEAGAFLDAHMHRECATYAMKVCPHIASPNAHYKKQQPDNREQVEFASTERPDTFFLLVAPWYQVVSYQGQPVFVVDPDACEITSQEHIA